MVYSVYKITNLINNKIYIGVHKTKDPKDSYMGSGKLIISAIKKYGIGNFSKENIAIFDNPEDMFKMESELVNETFITSLSTYNIKVGGFGGWDYANIVKEKLLIDDVFREQYKAKLSSEMKRKHLDGKINYNTFAGRTHSYDTKRKIGESVSKKSKGLNNSQFGTMWITNGIINNKILKTDPIPESWYKGRIINRIARR